MNRELVRLARGDRGMSLSYLILFVCAAVMVGNLLTQAFHLRAKAPQIAATLSTRADLIAVRAKERLPHTNFTVAPSAPPKSGSRS